MAAADSLQTRLRDGLSRVMAARARLSADAELGRRWRAVKHWQAERLRGTYADLLASARYHEPCEFFLEELYGAKDFEQRDAEALRVVPKLARMLPARAVETLLLAIELDELSEELDAAMAAAATFPLDAEHYAHAYRAVGTPAQRVQQISTASEIGRALDKLARVPMLSTMLHMMRGPAESWGLAHLHHFLQRGFDAFAGMKGAGEFLQIIDRRERAISQRLFAGVADPFRVAD